jgi:hemerythrin superfamily protein
VATLERVVAEHVQQEEGHLFPRLEYTSLDLEQLGRLIVARRSEVELRLKQAAS